MKNFFFAPLLVLLAVAGCKKEEKIEPVVTAKAGNFQFYSSGKMVTSHKDAATTYSSVDIEGLMANGASLKIWINTYTGRLDTLAITPDSTSVAASFLPPTPAIESEAIHGSLIILSVTPSFSGTFSFTCSDSTQVTGTFKVPAL